MLCLGRNRGEAILIGNDNVVTIRVLEITGYSTKLEIKGRHTFALWQNSGCRIEIDGSTTVTVDKVLTDKVKFAINALPHVPVNREEIAKKIKREEAAAAQPEEEAA